MNNEVEQSMARRPHHVAPSLVGARVVLAVKNFAAIPGVCHIGLGVTALNTMKVLRRHGVHCETWPAQTAKELYELLVADEGKGQRPVTHVIISAPSWVQPQSFADYSFRWPNIEFVQLNHSGCAYLSIDKYGIKNIRDVLNLSRSLHNVKVAGNNRRFTDWVGSSFKIKPLFLPNLYDTETFTELSHNHHRPFNPLRIGSFGASRPWKNQLTAAEAAVQLGAKFGVPMELYVNSKRPDGGERMIEARAELFADLPHAKLDYVPWALWPKFRHIVHTMDVMISASFDETFCVVVADGIAEGCPSVVTSAMEWTPPSWHCNPEDPSSIVRVATYLLHERRTAVEEGRKYLTNFVEDGTRQWIRYITGGTAS